jgi:hypothetical protein
MFRSLSLLLLWWRCRLDACFVIIHGVMSAFLRCKSVLLNLILAGVSAGGVLLLTLGADRALGMLTGAAAPPGTAELIFPPYSEEVFLTDEFEYTVRTNAYGIRDDEVGPKQEGVCRIAVIGDSFTFGFGVGLEDAWIKMLTRHLGASGMQVEVLNLGEPGAGFPQYMETAEKAIPVLRPDLVIVAALQGDDLGSAWNLKPEPVQGGLLIRGLRAWYPNTMRWLAGERWAAGSEVSPPLLSRDAEKRREGQKALAEKQAAGFSEKERARYEAIPQAAREAFLEGNLNGALISMAVQSPDFMANMIKADTGFVRDSMAGVATALEAIGSHAAAVGAQVLLLPVPHGIYVNRPAQDNYASLGFEVDPAMLDSSLPDDLLCAAGERAGWPCLTVSEVFQARVADSTLFFPRDGHLTVAGNQLMMEAVAARIEPFLPLSCRP